MSTTSALLDKVESATSSLLDKVESARSTINTRAKNTTDVMLTKKVWRVAVTLIGTICLIVALALMFVNKPIHDNMYPYPVFTGVIASIFITSAIYYSIRKPSENADDKCLSKMRMRYIFGAALFTMLTVILIAKGKYHNLRIPIPPEFILLLVVYICFSIFRFVRE